MEAPKATILIVDDVPENVMLLNRVLQSEGYAVQTAENGSQALAITQRTPPDLILLDINLPDADGFDVCARLKSNEQTSQIPVMFISALDDAEGKVRAFQLGGWTISPNLSTSRKSWRVSRPTCPFKPCAAPWKKPTRNWRATLKN